ncbi:MAG: Tar ligand binding domain-containing protein, partial [Pseudomonadota bacterium]
MNNLKISTRLMILGGFMSALTIVLAGLGLFGMGKTNGALHSVYEKRTVPTEQLGSIEAKVLANRLALTAALLTPTPEVIAASAATVEANTVAIATTWTAYMANHLMQEEARLAQATDEDRQRFLQQGIHPALVALRANDLKEAQRLVSEKVDPLYAPFNKGIEALIQFQVDQASKVFHQADTRYDTIRIISIGIFIGGMLMSGLFNLFLSRSIIGQLGGEPAEANRVAQAVGTGDLNVRITLKQGDNSSLLASLKYMQENLSKVVFLVRQGSETVATASTEIAQGNTDLSGRTESQANALEETAASMEELSSTVKQNADNARQANQLAVSASTVAAKGGEVVGQVVDTMKHINDSSKRIFDIISVIDGI